MPTSVRLQAETAARVSAPRQPRASGKARRGRRVCTHVCVCRGGGSLLPLEVAIGTHPPGATGLMWEDIVASTLITSLHPHPHEATSSAPGSENGFLGPGLQRRAPCDCSPSRPSSVSPTLQLAQNCYSDHATLCPAPAVAPWYLRFSMT